MAVKRAFVREAGLSFSTFSVNESEFHLFPLQCPMLRNNCSLATGSCETQAEAHQLFCWFLLLVSVGSLVVNGGCCAALCFQRLQK
jgi:hypothetical protein